METKMMKNMVVLRNIPSNIVEEAYIVFKDNVKIHMRGKEEHEKIYAVSEAEMIVSDYISKIEKIFLLLLIISLLSFYCFLKDYSLYYKE